MFNHTSVLARVQRELLADQVVFPTNMRLALAVREALDRDDVRVEHVVKLISVEPLMATRIVRMANCVAYNPGGQTVYSVEQAVQRVGFNAVRALALATCVAQIKSSPALAPFQRLANGLWEDSVQVAALSRLLARERRDANPDEAMLCGLVSEIGSFYLMFLASAQESYTKNLAAVLDLLGKHQARVGAQFLEALDMPASVVNALRPTPPEVAEPVPALREILREARRLHALPQPVPLDEPCAPWLASTQNASNELRLILRA
ncbi:MAG TPA: HDOD domain-containing protein [Macromonas sp.]|nr:HDOD domain-containing protein [Macromonas sp.]